LSLAGFLGQQVNCHLSKRLFRLITVAVMIETGEQRSELNAVTVPQYVCQSGWIMCCCPQRSPGRPFEPVVGQLFFQPVVDCVGGLPPSLAVGQEECATCVGDGWMQSVLGRLVVR
jgi:hypothetical protein